MRGETMALMRDLSTAQIAFQIVGGEVDQFEVIRYRGTEGLCQLYRFEIELASASEAVVFDDIVGKGATLSISGDTGTRWFHGVVSRFEMTGETTELQYYRVELVPALWLLTHRYSSRIFQEMTIPDIIADVLEKGGIPSDRYDLGGLTRTYNPRTYCVKYRETDYNFICRLMEEEGIWWYFEQTQENHKLIAADAPSAYAPIEGDSAELPYRPPTGLNVEEEHVFRFRIAQSVRPGKVVLRDFNFENPPLDLESSSDAGRDEGLEFSDYPGEYLEQGVGGELATLRTEEFEANRIQALGRSNSSRLSPGKTFDLTEHGSAPLNRTYLVTSVTHEGRESVTRTSGGPNGQGLHADQTARRGRTEWLYHGGQVSHDPTNASVASGGNPLEALTIPNLIEDKVSPDREDADLPVYECRFEAVPSEVSFRPPRVTPWPVMRGVQTARIVGPDGEEIYTDEYGRVKVQFNWDREGEFNESSSCWIRVSQGLAGGQYGMMFLPRIGQEVIVDFVEGNPDDPLITGRVYNKDHMPPYALPAEKTKSVIKGRSTTGGGGSNEIRFEDLAGSEQMLLYGQKDLHIRFKNNKVENIEANRNLTVGNNRYELVKKNYHLKVEEENLNVEIGGDDSLAVGGKVSIKVDGTHSTDVGGDVVEKFGGNHKNETTMTTSIKALSIKLEASVGIELKCGGSSIVLTPAAIFIVGGPLVNINTGAGPPVGPVTAMATAPEAPEAPAAADEVEHGQDTTYGGGAPPEPAQAPEDITGTEAEEAETEEQETTWVEIELVDEAGDPVVGERYEITTPDEQVKTGSTDATGKAKVSGIPPGDCQIKFPDLDAEAWIKEG